MDIDFVFKIGAIGILITVVSQVLNRAGREDVATLATLAGRKMQPESFWKMRSQFRKPALSLLYSNASLHRLQH